MKLTNLESIEIFHTALCNGLSYISEYGLRIIYNSAEYRDAVKKLKSPCYEDVLVQLLKDGGELILVDDEGEEDYHITIDSIYDRIVNVPTENLTNVMNENDDAVDADIILQTIFLNDIVFG